MGTDGDISPATSWPADRILLGGDYNPEQWPREVWDDDIAAMQEAGVGFVTLAVFSWSWLEPSKGEYEFDWLDDILSRLHKAGIVVDLATGTATPPPWFTTAYPEVLPVDRHGNRLWHGSRQAWCPSSPLYRDHATALTRQMAQRYADHPAVRLWHVGNEYACHNLPCYCDTCAAGFRAWLRARYGALDGLNDAWGTAFWSQHYTDWDQLLPPRASPTFGNPTQKLDYARYGSDALLDQYLAELAVLREVSPHIQVTTNFMTMRHFDLLDYHRWAPHQDIVSTDHYVVDTLADPVAELGFSADLTRGLAGGAPWILMEHSTSAVNWQQVNPAKPAGKTLRDSLRHVARGADTIGYFQWRQSRAGAEKYHSAMLPHAGRDSRLWREVCRLGEVAGRLSEVAGSRVQTDVALLWDFDAQWACDLSDTRPSQLVKYAEMAHDLHASLLRQGVTTDVVHPSSDLSGYSVILVPTLYVTDPAAVESISAAAHRGAHVLISYYSGIANRSDHITLGGYPGAFRDLLGIRIEEFHPLLADQSITLDDGSTATLWSEFGTAGEGTEVLAGYSGGTVAGSPALTRRPVGDGAAWYIGTRLSATDLDNLTAQILQAGKVSAPVVAEDGVELVRRRSEQGSWLFAINNSDENRKVTAEGHDLVSDKAFAGILGPGEVAVIRESG